MFKHKKKKKILIAWVFKFQNVFATGRRSKKNYCIPAISRDSALIILFLNKYIIEICKYKLEKQSNLIYNRISHDSTLISLIFLRLWFTGRTGWFMRARFLYTCHHQHRLKLNHLPRAPANSLVAVTVSHISGATIRFFQGRCPQVAFIGIVVPSIIFQIVNDCITVNVYTNFIFIICLIKTCPLVTYYFQIHIVHKYTYRVWLSKGWRRVFFA